MAFQSGQSSITYAGLKSCCRLPLATGGEKTVTYVDDARILRLMGPQDRSSKSAAATTKKSKNLFLS